MVDPRWVDEQMEAKDDEISRLNAEVIKCLERIEFLEKALEQAVECGDLRFEKSRNAGHDEVLRMDNLKYVHANHAEAVPELAKYLEGKNG